jgi:hypothetical protein
MKRALALSLLIPLVLAVSGCTIPGTNIEIPWINGQTVNYANDIIVIKSLQVTPSTNVKSGQTMTLYADIQNVQDPEKAAGEKINSVSVELYDHCTNLFKNDVAASLNDECKDKFEMSPQEIKTCHWALIPRDVSLITPCQLKLKVNYEYTTRTVTSITFIDSEELEARIRRGEPWQVSGSTSRGYGPVKAYVEVETQQPVPYGDTSKTPASVSVVIKNVGQGYIKGAELDSNLIHTRWLDADGQLIVRSQNDGVCEFPTDTDGKISIVRKQTTPLFCKVSPIGDINVEQTYDMMVIVGDEDADFYHNEGYEYEFRKSINVQIEPR